MEKLGNADVGMGIQEVVMILINFIRHIECIKYLKKLCFLVLLVLKTKLMIAKKR